MIQSLRLVDSRGDVVLAASSRELNPRAEYWVDSTPKGWYGGYEMRGTNTERIGHGSFPTARTRGSRTIEVAVKVHLESWAQANAEKRRISAALGDGEAGELYCAESGTPELMATVERTGEVLFGRVSPSTFRVSVPLTAPDSALYGPERVSFLQPVGTGVGLVYPLYAPDGVLDYGAGIVASDAVHNNGNATAWPTVLFVGDFPGGWRLTGDGKTVEWPWPTTHAAPVEVRMDGSIWIGASNVTHQASVREWMSIPPGGSLTPSLAPLQGGTGWAEVHHRDTYI